MVESFKICPICDTPNRRNAPICNTCGTSLGDVQATTVEKRNGNSIPIDYDFHYGETDLLEGSLSRTARRYTIGLSFVVLVLCAGTMGILFGAQFFNTTPAASLPLEQATPSPRPTLDVATVTQGPPTATLTFTPRPTDTPTITPTPEPCMQEVLAGDSLIAIIVRCGHVDRDVIPEVLEINGIQDQSLIQLGQIIEVPWPTPTPDPNAVPTEAEESNNDTSDISSLDDLENLDIDDADVLLALDSSFDPFAPTATATLPPGVMWHTVTADENITTIVTQYGADVKILSELNPEIDFALCEFGERFGGPECRVFLSEGQLVRVPAPTPTPTLSPTPSGSETPTPTPTATFNAPNAISPAERGFFGADELITLRWVATAGLEPNEIYRVYVEDTTSGLLYTGDTVDLFYIIPPEWRGNIDLRHNYSWWISVVNRDNPNNPLFTTAPRTFVWEGAQPTAEGQ